MIKGIKSYFNRRKTEKQMKYALLSYLYLFVSHKEMYIKFIQSLVTEIDYNKFQEDLVFRIAGFVQEQTQNHADARENNNGTESQPPA